MFFLFLNILVGGDGDRIQHTDPFGPHELQRCVVKLIDDAAEISYIIREGNIVITEPIDNIPANKVLVFGQRLEISFRKYEQIRKDKEKLRNTRWYQLVVANNQKLLKQIETCAKVFTSLAGCGTIAATSKSEPKSAYILSALTTILPSALWILKKPIREMQSITDRRSEIDIDLSSLINDMPATDNEIKKTLARIAFEVLFGQVSSRFGDRLPKLMVLYTGQTVVNLSH